MLSVLFQYLNVYIKVIPGCINKGLNICVNLYIRGGLTIKVDMVLVVNFGGQYAHLISRRLRELNIYTEVVSHRNLKSVIAQKNVKALILSGGPASVYDNEEDIKNLDFILNLNIPVLGICYGHQLLAKLVGGDIRRGKGEFGRTEIKILKDDPLFKGWEQKENVWMSHRDYVAELPEIAEVLAISERDYIAAFKLKNRPIYGVQFHPEVHHTAKGRKLLNNFIEVSNIKKRWKLKNIVEDIINYISKTIEPNAKALAAISGGIDSTVAAVLVKKVIGDRLVPVLVDHGLFRKGEVEESIKCLRKIGLEPIVVDARERFLKKLWGTRDCEERRRIIGNTFAEIFSELAEEDSNIKYLVQGTTYPDVIESGHVEKADKIKSHHNVAALPSWLKLKVVEPLKFLYKDEVRRIAKIIGVPDEIISKHPFPGPGFAVRVIGVFTPEKLEISRNASKILEDELRKEGLYNDVWQAFAVVGDDTWVGVKGDSRDVGFIVTLRIVVSEDAMTADWYRIPYDVLDRVSRRIVSELDRVTMVTYAISSKPPSTIEPC